MASPKTYRFPVHVRWLDGKLALATVPGKSPLPVASPPEFNGGVEGVWSPEDLFVGSVATCFTMTLISTTTRRSIPLRGLTVESEGILSQRDDGRFGFVSVLLRVDLETDQGYEADVKLAAEDAERTCLVAVSLDTPVHLLLNVKTEASIAA